MIVRKIHRFTCPAILALAVLLTSSVHAQTLTLESAAISSGADVLANKSILVVGQPVAGVMSSASFTIEVGQVPVLLAALKGDFDEDFDIDFADLSTFVDVLLGTDTAAAHVLEADINSDGTSDGQDIDPFVTSMLTL